MKMSLRNLYVLCLFLLVCQQATSGTPADKQYFFQQIPMQSGLSAAVTSVLVCAEKGCVWVGTRGGIGRYDGYTSKTYLRENIAQLLEDKHHNPWAVCGKIYRYDEVKDEFLQVNDAEGRPVSAHSLCQWGEDILFGGEGELYLYSASDRTLRLLHDVLPDGKSFWMSELKRWDEHRVLAIEQRSKAMLVDVRTGETSPTPFDSDRIVTAITGSDGKIWVAHYNQGVRCYSRNGQLLRTYDSRNSALRSDAVLTLVEHEGQIWAGTDGGGITVIDPVQDTSFTLKQASDDPYSLPAKSILCLYKDTNDGLWAGSVRDGLINIKEVDMKTYTAAFPGQTYGLSEKAVLSLYQEDDDCLWIGTDGGGINHYDARTEKFHHILSTGEEKVAGIAGFDRDHLLVSLFGKGLFTFHKQSHTLRPLTIVDERLDAALCRSGLAVNVFQNTPETVLLLSHTPFSYHIKEKRFTPLTLDGATSHYTYGDLLPIGQRGFFTYLYDQKHLFRLDARSNEMELLHETEGDTVFHSVSIDSKGAFWIGSNYGLGCYTAAGKRYAHIPHSLINRVSSLVCDQHGRVWMGSEGKLLAYVIAEGKFILYGEPDGVLPNEYLKKARLVAHDGDIYLGGVNGLLYINRQVDEPPAKLPFLQVADVYAGGKRMNAEVTADGQLTISERTRPVALRVSKRYNDVFRKSMYRFTVEGLSDEPVYSYQPEMTLNSLPAGTFRVKAACSIRDGGWTEDYPVLTLHVRPLWYNSAWFRLASSLLVVVIVVYVFWRMEQRKNHRLQRAIYEHKQQVNEEKVRFLVNVSHELRTPLTLIHSPLKQLAKDIAPGHAGYSLLQGICRQTDVMKDILNTVLSVSRMEVATSTLRAEPVSLDEWIGQLVDDFRPEAASRGIRIAHHPDASAKTLCFDKGKCTTVLTNLLANALKYTADCSTITVSVRLVAEAVRISVSDEGPGLKDIDPKHLFTRFYQGNNSRPGTGIGLSYCKILVEQHGGKMGAFENEGAGSTFWFELPTDITPGDVTLQPRPYLNDLLASTADAETPYDVEKVTEATVGHTLLVVDDNKDLTDYLHLSLRPRFKEVWVAADGDEALQLCREKRPDMVVSDIQMPRMNGYELCKCIKEDLCISHTPVVLLTARGDEESRLYGYKNGADAYVTKPFEIDTLHSLIHTLLENRKRVRMRYAGTGPLPCPEDSTFSSADEDFLLKLNGLINGHLSDEKLDVPFLCREVGMSRSSLYSKMKELVGMSTNDYIAKLRMERAAHLVLHTRLTVNEIADQVGFATGKYFSSVFKQHTGLTPTQYREQHRT